ncbi:Folliculin [Trichostrongylus colubriformis]|uniref:Folliculin n=1 Tax=Trichostrongylus colubriformis TaxID=6319 RepID=A0AAN8ERM3_TRICO
MMWTLRTEILRYCDQVLEGVPTQDMLVMMEMEPTDILELDLAQPNQHEVTLQQLANLKLAAKMLYDENETDLDLVIKQVITGGQLVVESPDRNLAKQLILALSNLLPIGCLKVLIYSETYETKYNLLGGPLDMDIPLDANVLVLRIQTNDAEQAAKGSLESCRIQVRRRPEPNPRNPRLLDRYRQLLLDSEVHHTVLDATIRSTREHWVSKAKLIYQMSCQKEITPTMHVSNVFNVVRGCSEQDRDVLTFWQEGLSKVYKESVIATINQLPH